jgi:NAD(P)H dehydrogenase (quinone)
MVCTLVVYDTHYGNTKKVAESVAEGARSIEGAEVVLINADEVTQDHFIKADAIIMGSPVHMGSCSWKIKKCIDEICAPLWMKDALQGKVGGVFATGSGYGLAGGGCEIAMISMLANFAELGLIIIPFPKSTTGYDLGGVHWGYYVRTMDNNFKPTGISPESLKAAQLHGEYITKIAKSLRKK